MSLKSSKVKQFYFPPIPELENIEARPFWSVMIPTYNNIEFLKQTLMSVLEQAPSAEEMQIEVVDDCSTEVNPKSLVEEIGQGRIIFSRQPHNIGLLENWHACIRRSRGHWIHLLHQDDFVKPGFYDQLKIGLEQNPSIGAAFCRHDYVNENNDLLFTSMLERGTPGIIDDWLERIASMQRVQFPSIVVNRKVYESLGGFCPQAGSAADWEMWKRIAAYYPVWYEPQILAVFRLHSKSESSRLIKSGTNIKDTRCAIEISKSYLPQKSTKKLSVQAKLYYANHALKTAEKLVTEKKYLAGAVQIREAIHCRFSIKILLKAIWLLRNMVLQQ